MSEFGEFEFPTTPDCGVILGDDEDYLRAFGEELIKKYLPCGKGDPRFAEITKDFGGIGTTCGFFVWWLVWRLGCVEKAWVNRTDPDNGLKYATGKNLSRVFNEGRAPFKHFKHTDPIPKLCDLAYLADGLSPPAHDNNSEHVFVFLRQYIRADGAIIWVSADAGQENDSAKIVERVYDKGYLVSPSGKRRKIIGYRSLTDFKFTRPATMYTP